MAFKATRKSTPPAKAKAEAQDSPTVEEPKGGELRIEDLVGTPQKEKPRAETSSDSLVTPLPASGAPASTQRGEQERIIHPMQPSPRSSYSRPGGGRYTSGYRRPMNSGYRRDYGPPPSRNIFKENFRVNTESSQGYTNGNGYTQDINVPTETVHGMLDIMPEGHGFLRPKFTPSDHDIYISQSQIRRFLLRNGDVVEGQARAPKDNERYWGLLKVEKVNDKPGEEMEKRPKFEDLVPIYPNKQLKLETGQTPLSTRMIDLVAPIGFGQRGLIVSPPKAGKTTILKDIAAGVALNYPNVHLMAALIGERPEEVTDISRSVKGEVLASNFDESPAEQTRIAEVALDRAKRLVEMGRDVVILLDSITRLARAYNLVVNPSGRTLSGGFDPAALYPAKRFLGAARCVEPFVANAPQDNPPDLNAPQGKTSQEDGKKVTIGGSLTVIGTALIDTGSRMDDLIYEEFKGTGNMELTLSRVLQERRIFPAIDVGRSGTRHDELLLGEEAMKKVTTLRHMLSMLGDEERTLMLVERLSKTKTNIEFLESLTKG